MCSIHSTQTQLWESYVASGRGGTDLFVSIDTNNNNTVSASELRNFLESIKRDGVNEESHSFTNLLERADDHELNLKEFLSLLVRVTQVENEPVALMKNIYESQPSLGRRGSVLRKSVSRLASDVKIDVKVPDKDDHVYSWNEMTMAQNLRKMQYAVRGQVVLRADILKTEGKEITYTNIGNPHSVGQKCITYYRQVLALCDLPAECGVDHPSVSQMFPADVVLRARKYRSAIGPAGTGAYTNSQGVALFRENVVDYISKRDGHPAYPGDIFLTNGASAGIQNCLTALIACNKDAIMIPIPQYPIYSALITLLGGRQVGYALDEQMGWAVTKEVLEKCLTDATAKGIKVKALAVINPGNPTGQVLDRAALETLCQFCAANGIVLLADEVYQRNVYVEDKKFISIKKVACEASGCENLELVSFHSTSKGLIGECGRRGGYMELHNICPTVHAELYKLACTGLCSGTAGQIMTSLMVQPPQEGEDSFELFKKEESDILNSLIRRSASLVKGLNSIPGIDCQPAQGAMYAFPSIKIPVGAIVAAKNEGQSPDTLYALSLLEATGICVVPASGFGQEQGRYGFRTTFLPAEETLNVAVVRFGEHHELFCKRYA